MEEPRRREVLRLLKLAGGQLEEAHYDKLRFEATRAADGRTVKAASMVCAAGVTVRSVPDSEGHWTIAAGLRVSTKTLEGISDPRVREAWAGYNGAEVYLPGQCAGAIRSHASAMGYLASAALAGCARGGVVLQAQSSRESPRVPGITGAQATFASS
jgi:hypothetical protein